MKQAFENKASGPERLGRIRQVVAIAEDYASDGLTLTVRQLYYQLVSKGLIENTVRSYKNTVDVVKDARMLGYMDWRHIEDRGRTTEWAGHWDSPADILDTCARSFRIDLWRRQKVHCEVMVEKDALSGVLHPVCRDLDVRCTANKGYSSLSAFYEIGQRLREKRDDDKNLLVLYLGDHDPSGIDMTRDVEDRLTQFAELEPGELEVRRLALNMDQVRLYDPPENPAKETDSRAAAYIKRFGPSSWELDALDAKVLAELVRAEVLSVRDDDLWDEDVARQQTMRDELATYRKQSQEKWDARD